MGAVSSIGKAITAVLTNNSPVSDPVVAIIGSPLQLVSNYAPQRKTYPQIIYDAQNRQADQTYAGASGLTACEVILRCISQTYTQADSLANAVLAAVEDNKGTFGGVTVQWFFLNSDTEDQFLNPDDESMTLYVRELQFECYYNAV